MALMTEHALADPLHPPIEPYAAGHLDVGNGHQIYFEQCGSPTGLPVVFLHGGPGSGCVPGHRQFFDPAVFRVILFDQRGCGRSTSAAALSHNTSDALVSDLNALRQHLGIARWLVVGGSWGAGLGLAFAAAYPTTCLGLVLRGVFLGRESDVRWFFQDARQLLPDAWNRLAQIAPVAAQEDLVTWLHAELHSAQADKALACALAWEAWEHSVSQRCDVSKRARLTSEAEAARLVAKYQLQSHYLVHGCFWSEQSLLQGVKKLADLPVAILHGRLDWVCRPQAARDLHASMPHSRLSWVDGCGHSPFERGMAQALVHSLTHFAVEGHFVKWGSPFIGAIPS